MEFVLFVFFVHFHALELIINIHILILIFWMVLPSVKLVILVLEILVVDFAVVVLLNDALFLFNLNLLIQGVNHFFLVLLLSLSMFKL